MGVQFSNNGSHTTALAGGQSANVLTGTLLTLTPQTLPKILQVTYSFSSPGSPLDGVIIVATAAPWVADVWLPQAPTTVALTATILIDPIGYIVSSNTFFVVGAFSAGNSVSANNTVGAGVPIAAGSSVISFINVQDFGALGNGVQNDAPAIQAAVDYAGTTPGAPKTIYFPPTSAFYVINDTIFCPYNGIEFRGAIPRSGPPAVLAPGSGWVAFGQSDPAKTHPYFVVSANNQIVSGPGSDGPIITSRTYNGGTSYFARLNPSVEQLEPQGFQLSDTNLGEWQGLSAFSYQFEICLLDGIPHQTVILLLNSQGALSQFNNALFHPTLRIGVDNVGTDGLLNQNGIFVQLQTSATANGNGFSGGVTAKSPAGSIVVGQVHHVRVVYDGAHITISIDGSVSGTPVACTGSLQQQWYEQVRVGGACVTFTLPNAQFATMTGTTPNIRVDLACPMMLSYALPTTYTPPVGEHAFIAGSGANVTMFLISFNPSNLVNPTNNPNTGLPSPQNGSWVGWYKALSGYGNIYPARDAVAGSVVYLRWRGTTAAEYIGGDGAGIVFENLNFGDQHLPGCNRANMSPIQVSAALGTTFRNCTFYSVAGPHLDYFSYTLRFDQCTFKPPVSNPWRRAWGCQLGVGVQFAEFNNCVAANGSWSLIAGWAAKLNGGWWNAGTQGTLAFGVGDAIVAAVDIFDDGGGSTNICQILCCDVPYFEVHAGQVVTFASAADVPTIMLCGVRRASIRTSLSASASNSSQVVQVDSLPADIMVESVNGFSGPQALGTARQFASMGVPRVTYATYDCSAGGAIAISEVDFWCNDICLTGTPAGAFQVQLPLMFDGKKVRFINQTAQAATVYTQAQAWQANTKYSAFAVMTPSSPNGKWYTRNLNNSKLALQIGSSFASDNGIGNFSNGVSGPIEPTWSTTVTAGTSDGQSGTNPIGVVGCWWYCVGNVGASSTRQAGTSVAVAAGTAVTAFCNGLGWVAG